MEIFHNFNFVVTLLWNLIFTSIYISVSAEAENNTNNSSSSLNFSSVSQHCLQTKPVITSEYVPNGTKWLLNNRNLTIYETKPAEGVNVTGTLIAVYDIFGFHPNTQQVIDKLASMGDFRIIMPDFFRGGWSLNNFPPTNNTEFQEFLTRNGSWEIIRQDIAALVQHYKDQSTNNGSSSSVVFGIFGFCWGGKISVLAASKINDIRVAALVHPSFVSNSDADKVKAPMYLLPSKSEPDMIPFYNTLVNKFGKENIGHKRFENMNHGFAAARGNFDDPINKQAVEEVIEILQKYFNQQFIRNKSKN